MTARVLVLFDAARISGPARGLVQLLRHQAECGYELFFVTFEYSGIRNEFFEYLSRQAPQSVRLLPAGGWCDAKALVECIRLARELNCSLVQSHGYKTHAFALLISLACKVKWLAVEHGFTSEDLKVGIYQRLGAVLCGLASRVVVTSPQLAALLGRFRPLRSKPEYVANAVDLELISKNTHGAQAAEGIRGNLKPDSSKTLIGCIGRFSPEKGQADLLQTLEQSEVLRQQAHLLLIGEGPEENKILEYLDKRDLKSCVSLLPYQHNIADWYGVLDVLVVPSRSEGMPNVLLEAMAFGKACAVFAVGAIPSVIFDGENGMLARPGDFEVLRSKLEQLVLDKELRARIGSAAKQDVLRRFGALPRARVFARIYNELAV